MILYLIYFEKNFLEKLFYKKDFGLKYREKSQKNLGLWVYDIEN